jgi:hypothetical protein
LLFVKDPLAPIQFGQSSPFLEPSLARVPAIVLPAASKILSVGGEPRDGFVEDGHFRAMQAIWRAFKTALDQARDVVVIGYSLPGTDAASTELLKHFGAAPQAASKRVLLVEPNPQVADRYRTILGIRVEIACKDFRDYRPEAL